MEPPTKRRKAAGCGDAYGAGCYAELYEPQRMDTVPRMLRDDSPLFSEPEDLEFSSNLRELRRAATLSLPRLGKCSSSPEIRDSVCLIAPPEVRTHGRKSLQDVADHTLSGSNRTRSRSRHSTKSLRFEVPKIGFGETAPHPRWVVVPSASTPLNLYRAWKVEEGQKLPELDWKFESGPPSGWKSLGRDQLLLQAHLWLVNQLADPITRDRFRIAIARGPYAKLVENIEDPLPPFPATYGGFGGQSLGRSKSMPEELPRSPNYSYPNYERPSLAARLDKPSGDSNLAGRFFAHMKDAFGMTRLPPADLESQRLRSVSDDGSLDRRHKEDAVECALERRRISRQESALNDDIQAPPRTAKHLPVAQNEEARVDGELAESAPTAVAVRTPKGIASTGNPNPLVGDGDTRDQRQVANIKYAGQRPDGSRTLQQSQIQAPSGNNEPSKTTARTPNQKLVQKWKQILGDLHQRPKYYPAYDQPFRRMRIWAGEKHRVTLSADDTAKFPSLPTLKRPFSSVADQIKGEQKRGNEGNEESQSATQPPAPPPNGAGTAGSTPGDGYEQLTVVQLRGELKRRNIAIKGAKHKRDFIKLLRDDDRQRKPAINPLAQANNPPPQTNADGQEAPARRNTRRACRDKSNDD